MENKTSENIMWRSFNCTNNNDEERFCRNCPDKQDCEIPKSKSSNLITT
ncbi:unnamed protein product [Tenebrio molitor]|nr:unnamed protein product [Tenebrio molitor]